MPNTYSQLYIHIVFAVKGRQNLISRKYREELHQYITGIVQRKDQKLLSVFAMPDHVHVLIGIQPFISISDIVREIKAFSSKFINQQRWMQDKFHWQEGYGAFSYSKSQINYVIQYILHQEEHHKNRSFKEEYLDFLKKFGIEYDSRYLFEWIE